MGIKTHGNRRRIGRENAFVIAIAIDRFLHDNCKGYSLSFASSYTSLITDI